MVRLATRLSGGGAAELTPLDFFTDVKIWLRPDPEVLTLNGGDISGWVNRGSLANITEATEARQATLVAADSNFSGKPSASFDGVANYYDLPDFSSITEMELFVILKKDENPPLSFATAGTWQTGTYIDSNLATAPTTDRFDISDGRDNNARNSYTFDTSLGAWAYQVISPAAGAGGFFINGVFKNTLAGSFGISSDPRLGRTVKTHYLAGQIADWILCGTEQSTEARAFFYSTYVARYGL